MANVTKRAGERLWRELGALAQEERELRREIGHRVLNSEPVANLRARRSELREQQEDLSCGLVALEASTP